MITTNKIPIGQLDSEVSQTITNGVTNKAPSEDAVFDALALKQNKSIVVSTASITAELDAVYSNTTTTTYTDPTPTNGLGYTVEVNGGVATVDGVAYNILGTIIKRVYESSVWRTDVYYKSQVIDISLTSTIQGWSSFTQQEIYIYIQGNRADIIWSLSGAGTGTTTDFTIPLTAISTMAILTLSISNGAAAVVGRGAITAATSLVTLSSTIVGGAYSGAGTRLSRGNMTIFI